MINEYNLFESLATLCGQTPEISNPGRYEYKYWGNIECDVPPEHQIFVTFRCDSRKGSVGKIIKLVKGRRFIVGWDDRENKIEVSQYQIKYLPEATGTVYIYNTNQKEKEKIKPPINRYGQELEKGTFIVAMGGLKKNNRKLVFGKVTRFTKSSVWINDIFGRSSTKENEIIITNFMETFVLPEEMMDSFTLAKLSMDLG